MKKYFWIILSIILIFTACLLVLLNITMIKQFKTKKVAARKSHNFICDVINENTERKITTTYIYDIITDKDYLVTSVNYIEKIKYTDLAEFSEAKNYYKENSTNKELAYDDKTNTISLSEKIRIESIESSPTPPFEMYKDTFIPNNYNCKEVLK